jgi:hypothetical protein
METLILSIIWGFIVIAIILGLMAIAWDAYKSAENAVDSLSESECQGYAPEIKKLRQAVDEARARK